MENDTVVSIIPYWIKAIDKNDDSLKLDLSIGELIKQIKSRYPCQISSLINKNNSNASDNADRQCILVSFIIWGPLASVSSARMELFRSNLSQVNLAQYLMAR